MVDLIEYLNQSGFTDLIRMFLIIGGLLSLVVFFLSICFLLKYHVAFLSIGNNPCSIIINVKKKENKHLKRKESNNNSMVQLWYNIGCRL